MKLMSSLNMSNPWLSTHCRPMHMSPSNHEQTGTR